MLSFTTTQGSSGTSFSMNSPFCGISAWALLYQMDIQASNFTFCTYGVGTNQNCTIAENISFSDQYSNYFSLNSDNHQYEITNAGNIINLVLTNNLGDKAYYKISFLAARETALSGHPQVKIYPNTVKDGLLKIQSIERIETTKIYNREGRLVLENFSDSKINVSSLSKGGYFLEIKSQQGISRHQFIKE